ncbi:MAG: EamA family transporter [Deltaproteobacteria bacterium]|nr:EamA family transporter [Deltaproteobacteria bacterium]MBW2360944.1 EamA family transporter [Deltaproteobacteria bacterium]
MTPFELTLVLASALLHAVWSTTIKSSRDPLIFNLLQGAFSIVIGSGVVALVDLGSLSPALWRWLALTSVAHGLYIYWLSRALEHGDLTLVYPIARSTPAFLPFVAVPLFGESLTIGGASGVAVVVAGMWLVQAGSHLGRRSLATPAVRYALLTLAATVVYSLADKGAMLELHERPAGGGVPVAVLYYFLLSLGHLAVFAPLVVRKRGLHAIAAARGELGTATLASLLALLGYGAILKALETAPASYVVAVRQASVFFALLLGIVRLRERPGRARLLGAAATVFGVALIALFGT